MTALPSVSVIIPARNAAATIGEQLAALAAQDYGGEWEVVVADNGSRDGTAEVAASYADRLPGLRVVDASHKVGANAARNAGASAARGEFLLFCDADDAVCGGWLSAMTEGLTHFGAVGGRFEPLHAAALREVPHVDRDLPFALGHLPTAYSSNMGVRRETWASLGGFNESYPLYGDDVEFCWRLQLAGESLAFVSDAGVRYRERTVLVPWLRQWHRIGRGDCRLYRDFRATGVRRDARRAAAVWFWITTRSPAVPFNRSLRTRWLRQMAHRVGRLSGCLAFRVWFP